MGIVPIIDIDRGMTSAARDIDDVCREVGFFQITGHGVEEAVARRAWEASRSFFDLPLDRRLTAARPYGGYPYGYVPISGETLSRSLDDESAPDLKEVFNVGPVASPMTESTEEAFMFSPTPWPAGCQS